MQGFRVRCTTVVAACLLAGAPVTISAQVGANDVALGKSAFQSSNYNPIINFAGAAVDGKTDGNYYNASVATTNADFQAWWYVDLGANFNISSITLWNRTDCCAARLSNFWVSVLASGTPNVWNFGAPAVWQTYNLGAAGTTTTYTPPAGTIGEFVKVQLDHADYLQLAEVDVEGTPLLTTTPEPASLVLMATGLMGLLVVKRRRRE